MRTALQKQEVMSLIQDKHAEISSIRKGPDLRCNTIIMFIKVKWSHDDSSIFNSPRLQVHLSLFNHILLATSCYGEKLD